MQIPWLKPAVNNVTNHRRAWLIALVVVGLLGSAIGFRMVRQQRQADQQLAALTMPVQSSDVALKIRGTGTIQPIQTVNVSPKTAGRIKALYVDQGDRVAQEQVIAKMDDEDIVADVAQARANLASAQARLNTLRSPSRPEAIEQAQAGVSQAEAEVTRARGAVAESESRLQLAETQLERQRQLAAAGAISENSLDEFEQQAQAARQNLKQAQAQVAQAQEGVDQAQAQRRQQNTLGSDGEIRQAEAQVAVAAAQLQAAQNRLDETRIRAPFDGVITQRYATVGAFVTPTTQASAGGSGATSTSIFGLASGLEVLARVPEVDIARIREGQTVEILADAYPDQTFEGRVQLVAPEAVVDQGVTYFQVRVKILTGFDQLRSGLNVDLNFIGDKLSNARLVPTVAIVTKKGQPGVLVPDQGNQPIFKPIEIGASFKDQTQVLSGLEDGDRVFTELPRGLKLDQILKQDE